MRKKTFLMRKSKLRNLIQAIKIYLTNKKYLGTKTKYKIQYPPRFPSVIKTKS